jgi:formamidopyrimidine-DNA glycosylase
MPEIPDLEGYVSYFNSRLPGLIVVEAEAPIPWMIRAGGDEFLERMKGQVFQAVRRVAKMLFFPFQSGDNLAVHAMLTGRYQYVEPKEKRRAMTAWLLKLDNGLELRYFDDRRMGRTFLVREEEFADKIPRWKEMGPDVMDPALTEEAFVARLNKKSGMIKNVITTESVVAGIGNAYSDEVLWEARLHPFRKRSDIPPEGIAELYRSIRRVMEWASPIVAQRLEEEGLPAKMYRDHLHVHARGPDAVCPRDGHRISAITSGGRETNFCRACQV